MIRTLTIAENRTEDGKVEYSASGSLPMDDAAKAMIIIAYQAIPPEKKEEVVPEASGQPQKI